MAGKGKGNAPVLHIPFQVSGFSTAQFVSSILVPECLLL